MTNIPNKELPDALLCHRTTSRVIYGDTDKMGFAYNANYLRWFEIGRTELFRSMGLTYREIESRGIYLPVSEVYCKFITPVQYDDLLVIETSIDLTLKGAMKFDYQLFNENGQKAIARGYTKHPCVDREGRVIRPPRFLREFINQKLDVQK
jgi:acyl-CoA thioester hydrolase